MTFAESERVAPESVLPVQFHGRPLGGARIQPEKRLQAAALDDAVAVYQRHAVDERSRRRILFVELEAWFASDAADGPFTFVAICDSLGLDPDYIRRGLRQSRARIEATGERPRTFRRDSNGARHHVVAPRYRRVA